MIKNLVSIVIPIYNSEKYLSDCLTSIENQTYKNIEVIFVDDGSTDNSKNIIETFCSTHNYAKFCSQPNLGVSSARNKGVSLSSGEYIYFLDADDIMHKDVLSIYMKNINPEYDLICSGYKHIYDKTKYSSIQHSHKSNPKIIVYSDPDVICSMYLCKFKSYYCRTAWNKLYKHEVLTKMEDYPNVFDTNIQTCEDNLFLAKYLLLCKNVALICDNLYYYRYTSKSLSHTSFNPKYYDFLVCLKPFESLDENKYRQTRIETNALYCWHAFYLLNKMKKFSDCPAEKVDEIYKIYKDNFRYLSQSKHNFWKKLLILSKPIAFFLHKRILKNIKKRKQND